MVDGEGLSFKSANTWSRFFTSDEAVCAIRPNMFARRSNSLLSSPLVGLAEDVNNSISNNHQITTEDGKPGEEESDATKDEHKESGKLNRCKNQRDGQFKDG